MKGKRRAAKSGERQRKRARMAKEGTTGKGCSRYARKKKYLDRNGLWGFEVPAPKPW